MFTRNVGKLGRGVGFIMEGWEIFKVTLHGWQRGVNPPIF